jgi:SAM-dependent methyltransferase
VPITIEGAILLVVIITAALAFGYWLFITTEGVYLGRRVVIWLYDVYARRYDGIKKFDPEWERRTLAHPLLQRLYETPRPLILDAATGTARLPLLLTGEPSFRGTVIGLDYSRKMLAIGAEKVKAANRPVPLIYQTAELLPFADNTFDAVTCLEALEFTPDRNVVIAEMVRVARPGAVLLMTNRKGMDARMMPGKTEPSDVLAERLRTVHGLRDVRVELWQVDYEQVWARKPGIPPERPANMQKDILNILRCPRCGQCGFSEDWQCKHCATRIPIGADGVVDYAKVRS